MNAPVGGAGYPTHASRRFVVSDRALWLAALGALGYGALVYARGRPERLVAAEVLPGPLRDALLPPLRALATHLVPPLARYPRLRAHGADALFGAATGLLLGAFGRREDVSPTERAWTFTAGAALLVGLEVASLHPALRATFDGRDLVAELVPYAAAALLSRAHRKVA